MESSTLEKKLNLPIIIVSIVIPVAVAVMFSFKLKDFGIIVEPLSFLPPIYASINALTAVLLIAGLISILNKKKELHKKFMTSAIACSIVFLVMYVAYHLTSNSVKFGDINHNNILDGNEKELVGSIRFLYYFILISHIGLSIIVIPFVLFTYVRALSGNFERHKKLARITFPIWLYVAITGVIVYLMISPYYVK
ncbi:DUF420 domain-containing protein [Flavobacterium sp.]|uniref:DUF420 domain-containing protein n=1 Tax=Flavobacterium sp. TaxID=239 RepID=UPI0037528BB8